MNTRTLSITSLLLVSLVLSSSPIEAARPGSTLDLLEKLYPVDTAPRWSDEVSPAAAGILQATVVTIATGDYHTCVLANGEVMGEVRQGDPGTIGMMMTGTRLADLPAGKGSAS